MNHYSVDLRTRVVAAYEDGEGTIAQIAKRFRIGERTLYEWLALKRDTKSLEPRPAGGGRVAAFHGEALAQLAAAVDKTPDATLDELKETCAMACSRMAVVTGLQKLDRRRKKKDGARSRTGPARR